MRTDPKTGCAGMMSHCIAMPDRSGSVDPSKIGEEIHSSSPIRWPGFSVTPKIPRGSADAIAAQTSPPDTPGRIIESQSDIAST